MKKTGLALATLAGLMVAGFFAAVSASAMVDGIEKLVPAESQTADRTGERFAATPSTAYLDVAESQKVDTSGPGFVAAPSKHYRDVAESQEVETRSATPPTTAQTLGDFGRASN